MNRDAKRSRTPSPVANRNGELPRPGVPLPALRLPNRELLIGFGAFGEVYEEQSPQGRVAVKRLRDRASLSRGTGELLAEGLRHPCIVEMLGALVTPSRAQVIMAYGGDSTALDCVNRPDFLPTHVLCLAFDVVCGIEYLHRQELVHLDLKLDNVLWCSQSSRARVADFGCMCRMGSLVKLLGPIEWRAPEVACKFPDLDAVVATFAMDLWALGTLLSCFCGPRSSDIFGVVGGALTDVAKTLSSVDPHERGTACEAERRLAVRVCWWRVVPPRGSGISPLSQAVSLGPDFVVRPRMHLSPFF